MKAILLALVVIASCTGLNGSGYELQRECLVESLLANSQAYARYQNLVQSELSLEPLADERIQNTVEDYIPLAYRFVWTNGHNEPLAIDILTRLKHPYPEGHDPRTVVIDPNNIELKIAGIRAKQKINYQRKLTLKEFKDFQMVLGMKEVFSLPPRQVGAPETLPVFKSGQSIYCERFWLGERTWLERHIQTSPDFSAMFDHIKKMASKGIEIDLFHWVPDHEGEQDGARNGE